MLSGHDSPRFLAATHNGPSLHPYLCLLFISPVTASSGCVWVGVSAALFFTRLSAMLKSRIFLAAAQPCNPPEQTVSLVNWQAGRLDFRGSCLPSLPLESGFLESCARHARCACTATCFSVASHYEAWPSCQLVL